MDPDALLAAVLGALLDAGFRTAGRVTTEEEVAPVAAGAITPLIMFSESTTLWSSLAMRLSLFN